MIVIRESNDRITARTLDESIDINEVNLVDLEKFIIDKLDENSLWVSDVNVYEEDDTICIDISIEWGDWKHEHSRLDHLMFDIMYEYDKELVSNYYKEDEEITDEDGSDTYSSIHKYRIVLE